MTLLDDRILYETDTSSLRFDAGGSGTGTSARPVARVATGLSLGADAIVVV